MKGKKIVKSENDHQENLTQGQKVEAEDASLHIVNIEDEQHRTLTHYIKPNSRNIHEDKQSIHFPDENSNRQSLDL